MLRLVVHAGEIGAEGRTAQIIERRAEGFLGCGKDNAFERSKHALAIGLPQRNQPHPGRDPVRRQRMQKA